MIQWKRFPNIKNPKKNKRETQMQAGYRHRQHCHLQARDFINYNPLIVCFSVKSFRLSSNINREN